MTDRELDALVAEKVFGMTVCDRAFADWPRIVAPDFFPFDNAAGVDGSFRVPRYASDFGKAWCVVEEMRRRGFLVSVTDDATEDGDERPCAWWMVRFEKMPAFPGNAAGEAHAREAPRAICIAALRALGVEVTT